MESDKHLYEIFEANPEWLFELTGRHSPGPSKFVSIAVKAIERRADGVIIPDAFAEPITVTELQMHADEEIYGRIVIEMAILQSEYKGRAVDGIIIFGTKDLDPATQPWTRVVSVYYLDQLLEQLAIRSPEHPLVAVFQPLIEKNREMLERNAARYYNQIKTNATNDRQRSALLSVFVDWMLQRFSELAKQEIENMLLGQLPDLRDTQAGKDLIAIGVQEGVKEGIKEGIEKGTLLGTINTCRSVLGLDSLDENELLSRSVDQLKELAEDYRRQVRSRFETN
jgi:predicted transposase YdaD